MRFGPARITDIILSNTRLDAAPREVRSILYDILVVRCSDGTVSGDPVELTDQYLPRVVARISRELSDCAELGRYLRVSFSSVSSEYVQGACFVEERDSHELAESKRRRAKNAEMLAVILSLSPDEFETLCGGVLHILGATNIKVTRHSADDGIDFYGRLNVGSLIGAFGNARTIHQQLDAWFIGQAKRYVEVQVAVDDIRGIVGSIFLAKGKATGTKLSSALESLKIRPMDPIFALIVTSGFLSSNAWRLVQSSGVVGVDGEMLSELLCERGIGYVEGEVSRAALLQWASDFGLDVIYDGQQSDDEEGEDDAENVPA
jgi:hypothetical protein